MNKERVLFLGLIRLVFPIITAKKKETSSHLFKGLMFMTAASVYMYEVSLRCGGPGDPNFTDPKISFQSL